jgi:SAM-dependent methyltransferase
MLSDNNDAFGHMLNDYLRGRRGYEVIERDDGYFDVGSGPKMYFSTYEEWSNVEKKAMEYVQGSILDIGCGAGRHALYLQDQGHNVLGIDISPLAVDVCQKRVVKNAQVTPVTKISRRLGIFDTILMMGNNFALLGSVTWANWLLRRMYAMTSDKGRIISTNRDPYLTDVPEHLEYHSINRKKGKLSGEARIRVRYKKYATPWFDFLMVSKEELEDILLNTGWAVKQ